MCASDNEGWFEKPYLLCSNRLKLKKLLAYVKLQELNFESNFGQLDQRRCYYYVSKLMKILFGARDGTAKWEVSNGDGVSSKKVVFVTVGTTLFDALVRAVDILEAKQDLKQRVTYISIKINCSMPKILATEYLYEEGYDFFVTESSGGDGSIAVDYFTLSSSIVESLRSSSLVISHAGTLRNIL
ncbi:hypothetical protein Cgig2_026111 [Carnegiea gigantea]|uniref:Glycosyl transferase family 28 C-terminal domain-containing protein n=1 Tax=Carnegiea gigantea TaxID=171969 RepID=A0A9Q1JKA9_9CARY|nr:hypothetical protein Cgig2_026111 [Carnegiea gigantea]